MLTPKIKICGITSPEAIEAAIAARADYVGLNFFPPSPRGLTSRQAAILGAAAGSRIVKVGIFVDADDTAIAQAIEAGQLDALQLHGSETPERAAQVKARFGLPLWKVLAVSGASDVAKADAYRGVADFILFDAKTPKGALPGGMGLAFDWSLASGYRGATPWGLAGGLNPGNVAEAIRITGSELVDTSSGVESAPGVKDVEKIAAFCAAARA